METIENVSQVHQSVDANKNVNYLDLLLHYTIENVDVLNEVYFLKNLLKDSDYVIFYYIEEFRKLNAKLTRTNLQAALEAHRLDWVNPKSLFMKKLRGVDISKSYLSSLTSENLVTPGDFAAVLQKAVLQRYDEIVSSDLIDEQQFLVLKLNSSNTGNIMFAGEILNELSPLIEGSVPHLILNGIKYSRSDALAYMQAKLSMYLQMLSPDEISTYGEEVSKTFANSAQALKPTFAFNLGKPIFSNPQTGFLVSVVAAEKLGKTRFVIGEMVFPTIMLGKNVLYLSGEMQPVQVRTILLVKYIFTKGMIFPEDVVGKFLLCVNAIRQGKATPEQVAYFNKIPNEYKETIILAEHELFYSGRYGKIIIKHISDDVSTNGKSKYFNVEEYFPLIRAKMQSMSKEDRYALVVRDHVNHMSSLTGKSPVETVTTYLQEAKTLATTKDMPFVYVVINHITTELSKKIEEQGNVEGLKLRGHNSNEEGKTADLQMFLYERPNQKRESQVTVVIENDRFCNMEHKFKTKEFILEARREVSDFLFFGEHKSAYPTDEQEFDDFLDKNQRG